MLINRTVAAWLASHLCLLASVPSASPADEPFIPRRQSQPPGPPLTPQQALGKMEVPEGFHVELAAAEPELVNPVAMAFDDAGRVYVAESIEYPRREAGPGRDRIKRLQDTNGDGQYDSVKVFADGLNIPSAVAVGYGGVWVANAPDILLLQDTNGDGTADKQTVVVTGFGRHDTHELPNSLTWGPDGYLYGLNGVFNRSLVKQGDATYDFTCAMFRIDPLTHRFELFAEGTSNPWGIAFDQQGEAFISACVIDHLWHITESGYYHRQGGPYPPHTWKIDSIVDHKHQMAAYCGIEFFDSPAYPPEYRDKLYMGNIHGGCINVDSLQQYGSTYRGQGHPDFLTANDVWFMPVAQKVGPDGCLHILDWYDRYHCYQDANADPEGIDRAHGRLYRVVHGQRPEVDVADVSRLTHAQLVELLEHPNIFYRQRAAVNLGWRLRGDDTEAAAEAFRLLHQATAADPTAASIQLLTTTLSAPQMTVALLDEFVQSVPDDPRATAWAVRCLGERLGDADDDTLDAQSRQIGEAMLLRMATAKDPRVRLQVVIAAGKLPSLQHLALSPAELMLTTLTSPHDDGLFPRILWQNLQTHVSDDKQRIVEALIQLAPDNSLVDELVPRVAERLLAGVRPDLSGNDDRPSLLAVLTLARSLSDSRRASTAVLRGLLDKLHSGEIRPAAAGSLLRTLQTTPDSPQRWQLLCLAGDTDAAERVTELVLQRDLPLQTRRSALATATVAAPAAIPDAAGQWVDDLENSRPVNDAWRDALLAAVVRSGDADSQRLVLAQWARLPVGAQATLASQMTQRMATAELLLQDIAQGKLSKDILGPDQVRALAATDSEPIDQLVKSIWGSVRLQDAAHRQRVVKQMNDFLLKQASGDPHRGWKVYDRICGQCHKMHQRGHEVGPDITRNGRGNFEQLIVSVFDPSLVIGDAYKSVSLVTVDGRAITGLPVESNDRRIVLKVQGGKQEVIPLDEIEQVRENQLSMMPEGLEEQMTPQEVADLFALLSLEKPPESTENRVIAGTPDGLHASP